MNNATRVALAVWLALGSAISGGCRSAGERAGAAPPQEGAAARAPAPRDWPEDARAQPMFDGASGLPLTWRGVVARAASADVVVIGEMHGHARGLGVARALFDDILAQRPNSAALSMEFFERDEQNALDDYLTGVTDEEAFRKASGRNDGNYPEGHRAMVEAAKEAGRPVIAANAPRRYVRLARTDGFEKLASLTPAQRAMFVIPQALTTGGYRDRFYALMGGMSADQSEGEQSRDEVEATVLPFYRSQNVWDATMADAIVHALDQGHAPVVHVVGQFHSDFDGGLISRIRGLRPRARVFIISMSGAWSRELTGDDRNRADVVVYVGE